MANIFVEEMCQNWVMKYEKGDGSLSMEALGGLGLDFFANFSHSLDNLLLI